TRLADLARPLAGASLDYVQVTIESHQSEIHEMMVGKVGAHQMTVAGIEAALEVGLQVVTNTTLTQANASTFVETLRWLRTLGIKHAACNRLICSGRGNECREKSDLPDVELKNLLEAACAVAKEVGMELQWYSPGCYTLGINPIEMGFGAKSCSAAAHNMTIQPDGSVLPCQSWPEIIGNILNDPWGHIWSNPICRQLRNRELASPLCHTCDDFETCGGGCPLDPTLRRPERDGKEANR
ncbi:MAG: radical SAM protein, partial [Thermoleophilia bacterium]|nr:radical SAM protein [Thermoleophilia bacterium]